MMRKISVENIKTALDKVTQSSSISGSERNVEILQFLVDCYIDGIYVKETVLEIELFKDMDQAVSYDGKVRVYMYNLRKKLEEYYRDEGKADGIIFSIKKGQYNLSVERRKKIGQAKEGSVGIFTYSLLLLVLILLFFQFRGRFTSDYCWESFFQRGQEPVCCVGDHFTVVSKSEEGKRLSSYLGMVDSDKDFEIFLKENDLTNDEYVKAPFSFVTKMGPVCAAELGSWFAKNQRSFDVVMEAELSMENINDNSIIYIGPFKTMDVLSELFLKGSEAFQYDGQTILDVATNRPIRDMHINNIREDHVMVSFNPLTDTGKDILFFAANNDIGVLAAVKNFTNREWLKEFYKNIPEKDSYFNALFKVDGIGRTELQCKLVKVEVLAN